MKYLIILLVVLSSCSLEKRLAKYCPLCVQKDSTITVIQVKDKTITKNLKKVIKCCAL